MLTRGSKGFLKPPLVFTLAILCLGFGSLSAVCEAYRRSAVPAVTAAGRSPVNSPAVQTNTPVTLDVLAYNIYMITTPFGISAAPGRPERGRRLPPYLQGYDVLILSEAFDNGVREKLQRDLRGDYPHQTRVLGDGQGLEKNGEVIIFSKHPIPANKEKLFGGACDGIDCFANKLPRSKLTGY